ncbi:BLUF domain-containing protein [Hymenobacter sp. YC55]|uniref:BLUF domain-containing protein n=1 Tax=Hymenobacter sp. YC55 TaxID=3034019 RepID=UPI0023F6ED96|nr:BLUF domain-containing protein [Hymenobacter sp. YC55]MDF7815852.1 BLUF domain-containing protein [Hymenobacter sp. YC55]
MSDHSVPNEAVRRRAVASIIRFTAGTPLAPPRYERQLLARYQVGELSIDQVLALLDTSTYHVFYRSQAAPGLALPDIEALVDWSRHYNAQHQLTGLLLYSSEQFVQVVEGEEAVVRALFARIQQDTRHQQVVTLSEGPGPQRWFAEWSMAWGLVEPLVLEQVLGAVQTQATVPELITDPHLQTLIRAFHLVDPELARFPARRPPRSRLPKPALGGVW